MLLPACGFTPIYGTASSELSAVHVLPIPGKNGLMLKAALEDKLDPAHQNPSAQYDLSATLAISSVPVVIENDGTVSRYRIDIKSPFVLKSVSSGAALLSDTISLSINYDVSDADYSTYVLSNYQVERGIEELSYHYVNRLSAYFASGKALP